MIRTVLLWLGIIIVILLVLLWFITGGVGKTVRAAQGINNSLASFFFSGTSTGEFRLPWQPDLALGTKVAGMPEPDDSGESQTPEEELARSQKEYDSLLRQIEEAKTFGEPSPYRDKVRIAAGGAAEGPASDEFIELEAAFENMAPIDLGGWSLQSVLTGLRAYIPRGVELFMLGTINAQMDIHLAPGASVVVSSGPSPVGTSFKKNICTGYLMGVRTFIPPLSRECPSPSESLPLTPDNLRTYGDACFDFVAELPPCTFPRTIPADTSPTCRTFLSNTLSYNGCVGKYQHRSDFERDSWRIYLNASGELWRNSHDIIRLLDAEGRTVDVVSY